jgi:two-component SAPR family response regulator
MINEHRELLKIMLTKNAIYSEISGIFRYLDDFQKLTQKSRRRIRKEASVVPFTPAKIEIRAFGRTEVVVKNRTLLVSDWKTQMSRDLFFLFLAHPEGLTKEEVGEVMWQELSPSELKLRFKNAIYRMRHAIGSEAVHFQDNYYQFNRSIDYEYDVQNFLNATNSAQEEKNPEKQIETYKTAIGFYQGQYLPEMDYSWIMPDRQKYHALAIRNILELIRLLVNSQQFEEALAYCNKSLKEDPCNEDIYRLTMKIYSLMGNKAAVSRQYKLCLNVLKNEINAQPSDVTVALFKALMGQ